MKCLQCNKNPSFGIVKDQPRHCKDHKQQDEWNVKHDMCVLCVNVQKRATYKDENGKNMWCSFHAPDNSQSSGRKCIACKTVLANFGPVDGKKERCGTCKLATDIFLGSGLCIVCNKTHASFASKDDKIRLRCNSCRLDTDVAVRANKCTTCYTVMATFGTEDDMIPRHCAAHKLTDEVDVRSKRCEICKKKRALYGVRGGGAQFCNDCRTDGHVNPYNQLCSICGKTHPTYGQIREKRASRCATCKLSDDVKITARLCVQCGVTYASFGNPVDGVIRFCNDCKHVDDVNLSEIKCIECKVGRARFGIDKRERCTNCRRSEDRNLYCDTCIVCDETIPSFAQPSEEKPLRCFLCKIDGDVSKVPRCIVCGKNQIQKNGHCTTCHPNHIERGSGVSANAFRFLSALEKELGVYIQFSRFADGVWKRDEHSCPSFRYKSPVDGFIADPTGSTKGTVIEYEGDEWHGHPSKWATDGNAKMFKGVPYSEKYESTRAKLQQYRDAGYRVLYIWESDALRLKQHDSRASSLREFVGVLEPTPQDIQQQQSMSLSERSPETMVTITNTLPKKRLFAS